MKKIALYLCSLLAVGFVACDDKSDLGKMQVNEQKTVMSANGVTATLTAPCSGTTLNLADYATLDGEGVPTAYSNIPVLTYSFDETVPEDAKASFKLQISPMADFSQMVELDLVNSESNVFSISCEAWDNAFRSLIGKAPMAKENYIRVVAYLSDNGQYQRIGDQNTYFCSTSLMVTPIDLNIQVDSAYYLIGTIDNWSLYDCVKFNHSDQSVYDDPIFTLAVNVTMEDVNNGGWWWKIVSETVFSSTTIPDDDKWNMLYGPEENGDDSTSGVLVDDGAGSGVINTAGQYLFTINMLDQTYEITNAIPALWSPGNGNGWGFATGELTTDDYTNYGGFTQLYGEFKLTDGPAWGGLEWSAGEEDGHIALGAPGNIPGPADNGLYWLNVSLGNLTYSYEQITTIGIIGNFPATPDWNDDIVELTHSDDNYFVWEGEVTFATDDIKWKFRCNKAWAISLGGSYDNLNWHNGSDLPAPGAGTYKVTLDLSTVPYTCTFSPVD